ncbi:tetratricopeptide repeat protein [Psychrobacter pygoscelis]|uniref:tetratricopeptide repeat protein n=2 Tax=Gammaproteobacteria TaxID=1236 RepID=UPI0013F4A174|nr:tetratricopeptide repeat protein [Psychrobacter pygoscelis]
MPVDNLIKSSTNKDTDNKESVNKNAANKDALVVVSSPSTASALGSTRTNKSQDDGATMAYRHQLQQCQLDYSIDSLKRIDLLISKIRHELIANNLTEATFLAQPSCQRFLRFVGRYSGQVLAKQWHNQAYWLSEKEIAQWSKKVGAIPEPNNFYQQLACRYQPLDDNPVTAQPLSKNAHSTFDAVYFALEPIGARLFASIDRPFRSVNGEAVEGSIFWAIDKRLPTKVAQQDVEQPKAIQNEAIQNQAIQNEAIQNQAIQNQAIQNEALQSKDLGVVSQHSESETTPRLNGDLAATTRSTDPIVNLIDTVIKELESIDKQQNAGDLQYQQALKVLNEFDEGQGESQSQLYHLNEDELSQLANAKRQSAIEQLKEAADLGHSAAMIRLALLQLFGDGDIEDQAAGIEWLNKAAAQGDSRGQRLLSKLHYQGLKVPQDITLGKYWLTEAANNGHPEAAQIITQWQQAEVLTTVKKQSQTSNKRYGLLFAIVLVLAVILFVAI